MSCLDSVTLPGGAVQLPPDTLRAPGSLRGAVGLQPDHEAGSARIRIPGTGSHGQEDAEGVFHIPELAECGYTAIVTTTEADYSPLAFGFDIEAGRETSLGDTLWPEYLGVPMVRGLRAEFDTAEGTATIRWSGARGARVSKYQVFRDWPGYPLSTEPIAEVEDTVFRETVIEYLRLGNGITGQGNLTIPRPTGHSIPEYISNINPRSFELEYRIRVVDASGQVGPMTSPAVAQAASAAYITARFEYLQPGATETNEGFWTIKDSLILEIRYSNRMGRKIASLAYYNNRTGELLRETVRGDYGGNDTLRTAGLAEPETFDLRVEAEDETGFRTAILWELRFAEDRPQALAGSDIWLPWMSEGSPIISLDGKARD